MEWVGAGSPPLLHTKCGAEPGIPAHVWASPFTNPLPNHEPSAGRLSPEGGSALLRAGVGGTWPGSRELGCRDVGSALQGCASHVLLLNFALSRTLPLPASFSIPLLLLPVTFRLFRVQCSVWLSSHQAIVGGTDEKRGSEGSSGGTKPCVIWPLYLTSLILHFILYILGSHTAVITMATPYPIHLTDQKTEAWRRGGTCLQ